MNLIAVLKESFFLLLKEPKLFLPKIIVAFLYGFGMLAIAFLSLNTILPFVGGEVDPAMASALSVQLPIVLGLLVYTILVLAIDVLVNAMYPVMVRDFKQGSRISFRSALSFASKKFLVIFPAILVADLAVSIPFALLSTILILTGNTFGLAISFALFLIVSFVLIVLFYVVYPVSVLKEKNFVSALLGSLKIGSKNMKQLSIPSLIPFSLSLINFGLAFLAENPAFLIAFLMLRFLIALVATYHMVLNPSVYFALQNGVEK
ncbi:MAG: hypothetical protein CL943_03340 [Candidatus Diapherotrites archaeon]|uniref:DUF4013 domain-containing protein n=1 Tax=Candidatus Iainarchaeum sp. TaxID=3101447 RepID=A0A2D6M1K5_9ARCH|nr:hypothetical protein [Candidatus Diapherotrites archaeon]|tara:strand:- start:3023 stop:3808 length:786 start_codon:yes stop_codon:yes gene_type:complete